MSSGIVSDDDIQIITDIPLLPVPSGLAKPTDKLCDSCTARRLAPRDFVILPGDYRDSSERYRPRVSHRFGLVGDIKAKSSRCPLCRLILQAIGPQVPDEQEGVPVEVVFTWMTNGPRSPFDRYERIPTIREIMPTIQKQGGGYVNNPNPMIIFPRIGILANDAPIPYKSLCARFIKDQIDFAMVRNWMNICNIRHEKHCAGIHPDLERNNFGDIADEIPSLRMIDVVDNCIAPAPRNCKYVALSYVWGPINPQAILRLVVDNVTELEKPGALAQSERHDKIPLTIRDAMLVVKELGMRYFWVDSLCIVQDDIGPEGSKMQAIAKMGLVYGAAMLTIVAYTDSATTGLPGVRAGGKRRQAIEEIAPGFRLAFKPMYQYAMEESVYKTRGWTFQEQRFSRKQLIFGGGQVTYVCPMTDQCREDEVLEGQHAIATEDPGRYLGGDDIGEVEGIFSEYTGRSLTNITDVYHAIAAFVTIFQRVINANLCHGVPDVFFDWFLLWEPHALQNRRSGITPSWSWSGWAGESFSHIWDWYTRSITKIRKAQKKRTWIVWYQRKDHGSQDCVCISSIELPLEESGLAKQMKKRFPFTDCSQTVPTSRKLIGAPLYIEDTHNPNPGSGFLQFWTISVTFDLDKAPITADTNDPEPWRQHGRSRVDIFGRDGWELGTIMVNPEWFNKNVPGRHEFIILCEARTKRAERDSDVDRAPGWKYMVMLIEWHGDGQWAERVAIGAIEKDDLKHGLGEGPVWKEIVLG